MNFQCNLWQALRRSGLMATVILLSWNQAYSQQAQIQALDWAKKFRAQTPTPALAKMPPNLRMLPNAPEAILRMMARNIEIQALDTDEPIVGLLVKSSGNREELEALGAQVGSQIGDIFSMHLPLSRLSALANLPSVAQISPSMLCKPYLDKSILDVKANLVHQGNYGTSPPTFTGFTGQNVLAGIIDTGIDWRHGDFIKDGATTSRIAYIWDQNLTPSSAEKKPTGFAYGVEYSQQEINDELDGTPTNFVRERDTNGHGTHVAGTVAGDGSATGGGLPAYTYVGMAPRADIVAINTNFAFTGIMDGVAYMLRKSGDLGKPAVVNMSLGTQFGPHDGTEPICQAIDAAVNSGKIHVVISAGNEGTDAAHGEYIHAEGTVTAGTSVVHDVVVPTYTPNSGAGTDFFEFNLWYQGNDLLTVQVTTPGGSTWSAVSGSDNNGTFVSTSDGAIYIDNASTGPDPSNGDRMCFIQIFDYLSSSPPRSGTWKITVTGATVAQSGHFDNWLDFSQVGSRYVYFSANSGNMEELIGIPGVAAQAITVGAYSTKTSWTDYLNRSQTVPGAVLNDLAYFSSTGPTRDDPGFITGRQKPEISAPGFGVVAALSTNASGFLSTIYRNQDQVHLMLWGTSMSAPHITGAVAVLLEKNSKLTPAQVKSALMNTARKDAFTGPTTNFRWGAGKLDMQAAANSVVQPSVALDLFPSSFSRYALAGTSTDYTATIRNQGTQADSYNLSSTGNLWPTTFFNAAGTSQITNTGTVQPNATVQFRIRVSVPTGTPADREDNANIRATSTANPSISDVATAKTRTPGAIPMTERFLTTTLDPVRWVVNFGLATVNADGLAEPSSPYSLNLDGEDSGGDEIQTQAFNLSGMSGVQLEYYYQRTGGGNSPESGEDLWVDYLNSAGQWVNLKQYLGADADMTTFAKETIALPAAAHHAFFQLRFRNLATPGPNDDWFIDDIKLSPPPDITVTPTSLSATLSSGQTTTRILTIGNVGPAQLDFSTTIVYLPPSVAMADVTLTDRVGLAAFPAPNGDANALPASVVTALNGSSAPASTAESNANSRASDDATMALERNVPLSEWVNRKTQSYQPKGVAGPGTVIRTITVPDRNLGLAWDGSAIWFLQQASTSSSSGTIYRLNPTNGGILSQFTVPVIGYVAGLAYDGTSLWLVRYSPSPSVVYQISTTGTLVSSFSHPTAGASGFVAWDGQYLWLADRSGNDRLFQVTRTGTVVRTVDAGSVMSTTMGMTWVAVHANGQFWANDVDTFDINQLNVSGTAATLQQQFAHPAAPETPEGICHDGSNLWVGGFNVTTLWLVDDGISEAGSQGWLSVAPPSGSVATNGTLNVTATFNSRNLVPGKTYRADLNILSNDPDEATVTVPVQMAINPEPYFVAFGQTSSQGEGYGKDVVNHPLRLFNYGQNTDSYNLTLAGNRWNTQLFDSTGTTPISRTPNVSPNGNIKILAKVTVDSLAAKGALDTVRVTATSVGNPSRSSAAKLTTTSRGRRGTIPFTETFPIATLDPVRWPVNNGPAVVNTLGANEPSAPYSLDLNGTDEVQSQVFDLAGRSNIIFRYYYEMGGESGDIAETNNDLYVDYADNAGNWVNLRRHLGDGIRKTSYVLETITLPAGAYHQNVTFRFRTTGDAGLDDWFVDDISLSLPPRIAATPNPNPFSFSLGLGDSTTGTITIANQGTGNLDFQINDAPGVATFAGSWQDTKVDALHKLVADLRARADYTRLGGLDAQVTSQAPQELQAVWRPEDVVSIKFAQETAAALNVGLIAAENTVSYTDDVRAKLLATGRFASVTVVNAAAVTPTPAELSVFDAVIVWSNFRYLDSQTLGNNLADYVDKGKGVVLAMFEVAGITSYTLTGRWESAQYYAISRSGSTRTGTASLGTISQPGHPIMNSVSTFSGGSSSFRPSTSVLTAGATLIANWSDGVPLVAVKTINGRNRADLGFFPVSNGVDSRFWIATTDGAKLMANALEWVAGGATSDWLSFDRTSGTVAPNTSTTINAKISAKGLRPDTTYKRNILISNNDPSNPVVTIPATLQTSPPCTRPTHFTFTANTSNTYALIIDNATLDGLRLKRCDEIGVFTPAGLCVGAVAWNDTLPLALSAWEDNPQTPAVDGYRNGEKMSFRVWQAASRNEYQANPVYSIGNGNFGFGAFARLTLSAVSRITQTVNLRQGWNWISFNVEPTQPRVDSVFAGVAGLEIVQNCAGQVYVPGVINQIGNLNVSQSYIIYMNRSNAVTVRGRKVAANTPIPLPAGWNCISYFPDTPMPPQVALQSILANLNIVKEDSGHFMIPGIVDGIKSMRAGRGYKAHLKASALLIYPGSLAPLSKTDASAVASSGMPAQHFKPALMTGENYSIVVTAAEIDGQAAKPGDEIAVFTAKGHCVGAGVWNETGVLAFTAWQDDPRTPAIDGYQAGEAMSFRLWRQSTNAELALTPVFERGDGKFGQDAYARVKLAAQTGPQKFALHDAYPNPFNRSTERSQRGPETTIAFDVPNDAPVTIKIYDLMGREVRVLVDEQKPAGYHKAVWDGRNALGQFVTSGVYLYRMKAAGFAQTKRVLFVK